MSERSWWAALLQKGLWIVVMTLVMGWLARSRVRSPATSDESCLAHPTSTLIVGAVCTVMFLAAAVLSVIYGTPETSAPWVPPLFLGFALLGGLMLLEYRNARHRLVADGMEYGRLLGTRGILRWTDVREVRYSATAKWFRLESHDGRVVRVSAMLQGLPEFARAVLAAVPAHVIDEACRPVLDATATGHPPPVWG